MIHMPPDAVARCRQLESHQRLSQLMNDVQDQVRGHIRNLHIVARGDSLELHGVCRSFTDARLVIEAVKRVAGVDVRLNSMLEVV